MAEVTRGAPDWFLDETQDWPYTVAVTAVPAPRLAGGRDSSSRTTFSSLELKRTVPEKRKTPMEME
jgi:hypothetical protein